MRFFGSDVRLVRDRERYARLLWVPQNPEHMFLSETVGGELSLQGSPDDLRAALSRFRLTGMEERNPYTLSEGEKRRLNLVCGLLDPRELILLDEPGYGLDSPAILELVELLSVFREEGRSTLMVTHSPELAFLVADRILVLDNGHLRYDGPPEGFVRVADEAGMTEYLPAWIEGRA